MGCWKYLPEYGEMYMVSDAGQVISMPRVIYRNGSCARLDGRDMTPSAQANGYLTVTVTKAGISRTRTMHSIVLETFVGPRPKDAIIRHLDGCKTNNALVNLQYGTPSENNEDSVRHGVGQIAKTHCPQGHEYTEENTRKRENRSGGISRDCHICHRESAARIKAAKKGRG